MKIIEISNLTKFYGKLLAINNLSFSINKGDFFSLLGRNGAGKSTTIGILTSLIKKNNGKVTISNIDIDNNTIKIKASIGFVPQEFNFNQFEIVQDIILNQAGFYGVNRNLAKIRSEKLLKMFGLWGKKDTLSMNLSGGMKRRLMMVRSLVHKPDIMILDEPTSGVDIVSRRLIWKFLKKLNKSDGKTIILTTHYLEEVENLCNNVAIIEKGRLLINTTVKHLLERIKSKTILVKGSNLNKFNSNKINIVRKNSEKLEVKINRSASLNFLLGILIDNKVEIMDVKTKTNKLEDLFLKIVG